MALWSFMCKRDMPAVSNDSATPVRSCTFAAVVSIEWIRNESQGGVLNSPYEKLLRPPRQFAKSTGHYRLKVDNANLRRNP